MADSGQTPEGPEPAAKRDTPGPNRRTFLAAGMSGIAVLATPGELVFKYKERVKYRTAEAGAATGFKFFTQSEARLITAMAERIFPSDDGTPGATDAHVVNYIDGQLHGPWGQGQREYRSGPFLKPASTGHGWQYDLTPAEAYRKALPQFESYVTKKYGKSFEKLSPTNQDAALTTLEGGLITGMSNPSALDFWVMFHQNVLEGLFADPVYGGNHNMVGWRWIGFPGNPLAYGDPYEKYIGDWYADYSVSPKPLNY
ncbi:MAG: gluconate 2-dehydrogenase subunit 3 family protein [Candidatus Dormibacteraeota bacterium]|nr:gluconate 2-dehydrogenase subunit 3 family protein [Candidatus Dormibacteraeota bacterium]